MLIALRFDPTFQFSNSAMEGATKWDPIFLRTSDEAQQVHAISAISTLEVELPVSMSLKLKNGHQKRNLNTS